MGENKMLAQILDLYFEYCDAKGLKSIAGISKLFMSFELWWLAL